MAILKHSSSKNMSYDDAFDYLKYKHREDPATGFYKPILDEYGLTQERDNYALCYLDGHGKEHDPHLWAGACMETNLIYGKNNTRGERKQHMYVISHPEEDTPLLTKEALLEEGKAFVRENLKGYDALIAVHMDTDNYHIHIALNSVRSVDREEQKWMMKDSYGNARESEMKAGFKHEDGTEFRKQCQRWLLDYTEKHGLTKEDNLAVEQERKQERYRDRHEETRKLILSTASECSSISQLQKKLAGEYEIRLVLRGKTYTVHLPNSKKGVRLKTIGLTEEDLLKAMGITPEPKEAVEERNRIDIEKRQYVVWLRNRRQKNNMRTEDLLADAAKLIADKIQGAGRTYSRWDFQELYDLIKQAAYAERDLQTELDKINRLLDRWNLYHAENTLMEEKQKHGSYIRWCGCDPDNNSERQEWVKEAEVVQLQIQEAQEVRKALVQSAEQWKDRDFDHRFRYHYHQAASREEQLKQELAAVKANRKKLQEIAHNCQMAAGRRIYKKEHLEKAEYFRSQWNEKLQQEKALKEEIRRLKAEKQRSKKNAPER